MRAAETTLVERRLLLADDADRAVLDRYAAGRGWSLANTVPWSFTGTEQRTWTVGDGAEVLYGEFHGLGGRIVSVHAAPDDADRLAADLRTVLPTVGHDAALAALSAEPHATAADAMHALRMLKLAHLVIADPPDELRDDRLPAAYGRAAGHPDRVVRLTAVMHAGDLLAHRPDIAGPVLARRADSADDPDLAELFRVFTEMARAHGIATG